MIDSTTLAQPGMRFVNIHQNQDVTYEGLGTQTTFRVHGTNPYGDKFANAHLDLTLAYSQSFSGAVVLDRWADVTIEGVHATSYSYDGTHLKLYAGIGGNTLIDELTLKVPIPPQYGGISVASFPDKTLITTGRLSLGEGASFAISPHVTT